MAPTDNLDLSGDLYEGNFEEWAERLVSWMRYKHYKAREDENPFGLLHRKQLEETASRMCLTTAESVLARVPDCVKTDGQALHCSLAKTAAPFRFLDLSAEIRNEIYGLMLPKSHNVLDSIYGLHIEDSQMPPILQANSQIRCEAISIFYHNSTFYVTLDMWNGKDGLLNDRALLEKWSRDVVKENLKRLRSVQVYFGRCCAAKIKFSEGRGLTCEVAMDLDGLLLPEGKKLLSDHSRFMESSRKAMGGLTGEAVMMAVLANWEIWYTLFDQHMEEDI